MAKRILVVDDDELVRIALGELLAAEGVAVVAAADGIEALSLAADRFDLALVDLVMPGPSGLEVCRALRGLERWQGVPIFVLSARGGEADRAAALAAGATRFLPKPIDPAELHALVLAALGPG
ncbi:MAG: response regulator [Deferrisomatales bacterium]